MNQINCVDTTTSKCKKNYRYDLDNINENSFFNKLINEFKDTHTAARTNCL